MHPLVPVRKETGTKGLDGCPFFTSVWTLVEPSDWILGGLALQLHHMKVASGQSMMGK
jgi:hypothetical protein